MPSTRPVQKATIMSRPKKDGKNKSPKNSTRKRTEPLPMQRKALWKKTRLPFSRYFLGAGKFASALAVILTILGTYYAFSPKLIITPAISADLNPLATKFDVCNTGMLWVNAVKPMCRPRSVETELKSKIIMDVPYVMMDNNVIRFLNSGECTSVELPIYTGPIYLSGPVKYTDIDVVISYEPAFIPITLRSSQRFITEKTSDGKIKWSKKAFSE